MPFLVYKKICSRSNPLSRLKKNVALVQGKKGALDNSEWRENLPDITQRLQWKVSNRNKWDSLINTHHYYWLEYPNPGLRADYRRW